MKLLSGCLTLLFAVLISAVAGYFSIVGLAAIFAATFWPVIGMGVVLEASKLMAAAWAHANWHNPRVNFLHKIYLVAAVIALMLITSIGIYGYLSKGHLEQEAPIAGTQLQIDRKLADIKTDEDSLVRLKDRQAQLDAAVSSLIDQKYVVNSQKLRDSQKAERAQIALDQTATEKDIARLNDEILPLRIATTEVNVKLGPIKYVAQLFGWTDTDAAVRMVILILMFAFDPLAVVMVLSSTISFTEWSEERAAKKALKASAARITVPPEAVVEAPVRAVPTESIPVSFIGDAVPEPEISESLDIDILSTADIVPVLVAGVDVVVEAPKVEIFMEHEVPVEPQPVVPESMPEVEKVEEAEPVDPEAVLLALLEQHPTLIDKFSAAVMESNARQTVQKAPLPSPTPPAPRGWLDGAFKEGE